jgi:hypothetical protein
MRCDVEAFHFVPLFFGDRLIHQSFRFTDKLCVLLGFDSQCYRSAACLTSTLTAIVKRPQAESGRRAAAVELSGRLNYPKTLQAIRPTKPNGFWGPHDFRVYADNTSINSRHSYAARRGVESRGRINECQFAILNRHGPQLVIAISQKLMSLGKRCLMDVSMLAHGLFVFSFALRLLTCHATRNGVRTEWLEHDVS